MRWFVRIAVALTLSTVGVVALTRAGWPRPRFVVALPAVGPLTTFSHDSPDSVSSDTYFPTHRDPWLGFQIHERVRQEGEVGRRALWFVNLDDGRTAGPWDNPTISAVAWDHGGAAIVRGVVPADEPGCESIGRFDPETLRYRRLVGDRGPDFLVSGRGTVLVTSNPGRQLDSMFGNGDPGAEDFVCYDLTEDTLRPVRMALVVPDPKRPHTTPKEFARDEFGGVAVSPDGLTLAVSDLWKAAEHPWGITLLDTRTGAIIRRLTDLGPRPARLGAPADLGPEDLQFANDGRHLMFSWTAKARVWRSSTTWSHDPFRRFDVSGRFSVMDLVAGVGFRQGDWLELHQATQTPDGSLRFETEPPYQDLAANRPATVPTSLRVVDRAGAAKNSWLRLTPEESNATARSGHHSPLVPETTGYAALVRMPARSPWFEACRKRLGLNAPPLAYELTWIDWATGRRQVLRHLPDTYVTYDVYYTPTMHVGPGRMAMVVEDPSGGPGKIEIWDAPPPPWLWSVPAGIALGVLLTAAGVRLRRPRSNRT